MRKIIKYTVFSLLKRQLFIEHKSMLENFDKNALPGYLHCKSIFHSIQSYYTAAIYTCSYSHY